MKKHDTQLLIGHIAFLTCGKSDTRRLIGLHRFANENLLCGFSVCKSQYVYDKKILLQLLVRNRSFLTKDMQTSLKQAKYADLQICKDNTHGSLNTYILPLKLVVFSRKKIHCVFVVKLCGKINTSIVRVSVRNY